MPWGLKRFQQTRNVHFLTFSCYRRRASLDHDAARATLVSALEHVRRDYGLCVYAYVVMPEHVHLLVSEPGAGPALRYGRIGCPSLRAFRRLSTTAADIRRFFSHASPGGWPRLLISLIRPTPWVPRSSRFLRRAGTTDPVATFFKPPDRQTKSRSIPHSLARPGFLQQIEPVRAPAPLLSRSRAFADFRKGNRR